MNDKETEDIAKVLTNLFDQHVRLVAIAAQVHGLKPSEVLYAVASSFYEMACRGEFKKLDEEAQP